MALRVSDLEQTVTIEEVEGTFREIQEYFSYLIEDYSNKDAVWEIFDDVKTMMDDRLRGMVQ